MTRVMVTGGCGFIGSNLVDLLTRKGHEVLIIDDLSSGNMKWVEKSIIKKNTHFDLCDIYNRDHIFAQISVFRPEFILHLAAQPAISTSWAEPVKNAQINEIGTLWIIEASKAFGVRRIVMASTSAVYKLSTKKLDENSPIDPGTPYGISKLAAEQYLRALMPGSVILRLGNVYGPRQMPIGENQVVARILRHFLYGDDFSIHGDGTQKRDFVYVEDVAQAFADAMWQEAGTYNVATGKQTSVNDVANAIARMYDVGNYSWTHTKDQDPRRTIVMDVSKAQWMLGWKATTSLLDGLYRTVSWWNDMREHDKRPHRS